MDTNPRIVGQWTVINSRLVWVWTVEEISPTVQLDLIRSRVERDHGAAIQKAA